MVEPPSPLLFGPFVLDAAERRLTRDGEPVELTPKTFDLLVALAGRRGKLATREELLEEVWPGSFVDENTLSVHVSKLRSILGDSAQRSSYVETVPRVGYRFIAPVGFGKAPAAREEDKLDLVVQSARGGASLPARANRRMLAIGIIAAGLLALTLWGLREHTGDGLEVRSLAVLPLTTAENSDDGLGLSLADALITQLGALDGLAVRPTHSIANLTPDDPSTAGRSLRTEAVLVGRLQHAGGRVRVTLQLIRTRDGEAIWTGAFSTSAADRIALQDELVDQIVYALERRLTREERDRLERTLPRDPMAHEAFLRGRHAANQRTAAGLRTALEAFRDAVAAEPTFAPAHAEMARAYALLVWYDGVPPSEAFPRSRAAAEEARRLDPTLPEALLALGSVAWLYDNDVEQAEALFREAVRHGPQLASAHHQLGEFLALTGRLPEGLGHLEKARALDPLSPVIAVDAASAYLFNGHHREAARRYRAVLDLEPGFAVARVFLTTALEVKGDLAGAINEAERAVANGGPPLWRTTLARAYALDGRAEEARYLLTEIESLAATRFVSPVGLALVHEALGDRPATLDALALADSVRDPMRIYRDIHPGFATLRE